jgi:hypothetical protein
MFKMDVGALLGVDETIRELEIDAKDRLVILMQEIGELTLEYLRSFTTEFAPPIRPGDPARRRHPGYWADRSGDLARAYDYVVSPAGDGVNLVFANDMPYAAELEARDGYFVLSGVTDKGGPVEQAMRAAVAKVAPDWEVVSYE